MEAIQCQLINTNKSCNFIVVCSVLRTVVQSFILQMVSSSFSLAVLKISIARTQSSLEDLHFVFRFICCCHFIYHYLCYFKLHFISGLIFLHRMLAGLGTGE